MSSPSPELIYAIDDRPPWPVFLLISFQHVVAMFSGVVIVPLIIAKGAGLSFLDTQRLIQMAILASAISTGIQVVRGYVGSGLLIPMGSGSTFIPVTIAAAISGGVPLICGMTVALSPVEFMLGFGAGWFNRFVPHWLRGSMILLIAMALIPLSIQLLQGEQGSVFYRSWQSFLVGLGVIALTFLLSKSKQVYIQVSSVLIATAVCFVISAVLGMINFEQLRSADWVHLMNPIQTQFSFSWGLVLPFAICYAISAIETLGNVYAFAEVSMPGRSPDPKQISGGIVGDAMGSLICGLVGTVPNTSYAGHAAIIRLTRAASRWPGIGIGVMLLVLWSFPKLSAAVALLPYSVVGGVVVLAAGFMILIAVQMIRRDVRILDSVFIVLASIVTLALAIQPKLFSGLLPPVFSGLAILFESSMTCGALLLIAYLLIGRGFEKCRGAKPSKKL